MKRLVLLVVVALGMSATSFAGEKVEGKDWKVDVNVAIFEFGCTSDGGSC